MVFLAGRCYLKVGGLCNESNHYFFAVCMVSVAVMHICYGLGVILVIECAKVHFRDKIVADVTNHCAVREVRTGGD